MEINAYHMDEYIGLDKNAPQGFGNFLKAHIFGLVPFKSVNYIDITATDPEKEAERYVKLLKANPTDIVVMGIGENGHIAFNEPNTPFGSGVHVVKLTENTIKDNSRLFADINDVVQITHFKKSDKLVLYFKDAKYTVVIISPEKYEDFIFALREENRQIIYDSRTDGEDEPQ